MIDLLQDPFEQSVLALAHSRVLEIGSQGRAQLLHREQSAGLDRAQGRAGPQRDLVLGQSAEEGQLDHLALLGGKRLERPPDPTPALREKYVPLAGEGCIRRRVREPRLERHALGDATAAQPVDGAAPGDQDQPAGDRRSAGVVAGGLPPGLQERLLNHVLGIGLGGRGCGGRAPAESARDGRRERRAPPRRARPCGRPDGRRAQARSALGAPGSGSA